MNHKAIDVPYELTLKTIEGLSLNDSTLTGKFISSGFATSDDSCHFGSSSSPTLFLQGSWKISIENNSDIDFFISNGNSGSGKADGKTLIPPHSTIEYSLFENLNKGIYNLTAGNVGSKTYTRWDDIYSEKYIYLYYNSRTYNYFANFRYSVQVHLEIDKTTSSCSILGYRNNFYYGNWEDFYDTKTYKGNLKSTKIY